MIPRPDTIASTIGTGAIVLSGTIIVSMWVASDEPTDPNALPATATVQQIIDGDTIEVRAEGQIYTVRFARLDAPETDEPGGSAATQALSQRIAGETVELDWGDDEGRMKGYYGRWLAHVHHDGADVEEWMVDEGHGELAY